MNRVALFLLLASLLSACPQPYDPCVSPEDCGPELLCVGSGAHAFCSLECLVDDECPPSVTGQAAVCSLQLGAKVCVPW